MANGKAAARRRRGCEDRAVLADGVFRHGGRGSRGRGGVGLEGAGERGLTGNTGSEGLMEAKDDYGQSVLD